MRTQILETLNKLNRRDLFRRGGEILSGDLKGAVAANTVDFRTSHQYEGTRLFYEFTGKVNGDTMEGKVNLGEYGEAKWTARRHKYA